MNTRSTTPSRAQTHYSSGVFAILVSLLLVWGALNRNNSWLSAEEGLGYALGIIGGSLMLCLLLYPLRKRMRWMRSWLTVKVWFQMHMLFGILGPVAIAFHANFNLGSLNGLVATASMILVVISGLIGRYLYRRIHMGLYGQRATLTELKDQLGELNDTIEQSFNDSAEKTAQQSVIIDAVESLHRKMVPEQGVHGSLGNILWATPLTRIWYWKTRRQLRKLSSGPDSQINSKQRKDIDTLLRAQARTVRKLVQLELFSRLFAWWHIVHLPFFILMVITAIVHIFAVHSY